MGELNITPMIDVMLALLIIFMVVTPVLTEYSADPPPAVHVTPQTLRDAVTLGIDAHGTYFLGEDSVPAAELVDRLRELYLRPARRSPAVPPGRSRPSLPGRPRRDRRGAGRGCPHRRRDQPAEGTRRRFRRPSSGGRP